MISCSFTIPLLFLYDFDRHLHSFGWVVLASLGWLTIWSTTSHPGHYLAKTRCTARRGMWSPSQQIEKLGTALSGLADRAIRKDTPFVWFLTELSLDRMPGASHAMAGLVMIPRVRIASLDHEARDNPMKGRICRKNPSLQDQ